MVRGSRIDEEFRELPSSVTDYVGRLVRMIGYRRKVRRDVRRELLGHFADALRDCSSPEETQAKAEQLIAEFGDPQLLAFLCRRAKKRCRPLWLKAIAFARALIFLTVSVLTVYAVLLFRGDVRVTPEYIVELNKISRPETPVSDNAWSHYEEALSLYIEPNDIHLRRIAEHGEHPESDVRHFSALKADDQQALRVWLARNEAAWQEFVVATGKSCHYRVYRCGTSISRGVFPSLWKLGDACINELAGLVCVGIWKSRVAVEEGRLEEGVESALVVARAGGHWQSSAMGNEQLCGLWMTRLAHNEILGLIRRNEFSASGWQDLQAALEEVYRDGYPFLNVEGERLCLLDMIQRCFTEGGLGGGHIVPGRFVDIVLKQVTGRPPWMTRLVFTPIDLAVSMIHARRDKTVAKVNELFDGFKECVELTPHYRHTNDIDGLDGKFGTPNELRHELVYLRLPDERWDSELVFQGRTLHEATVTILALKRYGSVMGE